MLKYLFGKKKKLPVLNNKTALTVIQEKLIQPNLKNLTAMRLAVRTHKPSQKRIAVLRGKPRLNKKHTQGLTARNIQKMGYPRGPYPHVMSGGNFSEGNVELFLFNFLSKNIAKRKKIPYTEFRPTVMNLSYNNLLTMESRNTRKSKNNINKSVRRRAPRGLEYMYGKHNNYPDANSNYRNAINKLNTYQNSIPNRVRGALNRIAS
jgi:hypothetical protein